jgi:hypothetical protein
LGKSEHNQARPPIEDLYLEERVMSPSLQDVLNAARRLPPDELRRLVEQLVAEVRSAAGPAPEEARKRRAVSIVEEAYGSIKGLDRATLISLAEDEQYSRY